ncbi:MAG: DNA polymerase III subunit gamma/tau [Oscillospiraceae bacterium]
MKIALYRKYRSKKFEDVIGQESAAAALKNQIKSGKIGHSYIFTGIRGTGKTSFARILAKAVNCPNNVDGEPCGECEICHGIDDGTILDVTEIDAASNSGVDNIRELRDETAYAPNLCKMRVYIIDEVHMLTKEAFNALLKIMEEPPSHVMFILATTEIHKVPATILSRCQRFDLKRISHENIVKHLMHISELEGIDLHEDGAALIARLSDGAMRDALSLLDTCSSLGGTVDEEAVARLTGLANKEYLFALTKCIREKDLSALFIKLSELYENSLDATRLCTELTRHIRNLLMMKLSGKAALNDCSSEDIKKYGEQCSDFSTDELLSILRIVGDTADKLGGSIDRMLLVELMFIRLCDMQMSVTPAAAAQPDAAARTSAQRSADEAPWDIPLKQTASQPKAELRQETPREQIQCADENKSPEAAKPRQKPSVQGEPVPIAQWPQVIENLRTKSGMLFGFLQKSKAYLTDTHVLIEASDIFMQHVRDNADSKNLIKKAIAEITGINLPIGPFTAQAAVAAQQENQKKPDNGLDELIALAQDSGIDVEIK